MSLPEVSLGGGPAGGSSDGPKLRTRRPDQTGPEGADAGPGPTLAVVPDPPAADGPDLPDHGNRATGSSHARTAAWVRVVRLLQYCMDQVSDATRRAGASRGPAEAQPESWRQFRARVAARGWLPDGYDGKALIVIPTVFYNTVGNVGWGVGQGVAWLCTHMFAFMLAFLLVATAITLWLCLN